MHIGLNAHLLSGKAGYRTAGIHGYIDGLLRALPHAAPDWRFTAFVGSQVDMHIDDVTLRRSRMDTESPLKRILWEQTVQPFALASGGLDLYHALAFVAPFALNLPSVVTIYDLSFIHYPERLPAARRLYLRAFTGLTCRRARRVIAISQSTARDLVETLHVPADKIDVAAPGCDPAVFRPLPAEQIAAFRRTKNLPDRFWLFIGTLEPRKNLLVLLEAYAALPQPRPPLIIGGGKGWNYEPIFAAVERHNLGQSVQFVGFIPSEDLPIWYNCAEVFIYPSVFEGFGLPVLEAMACGTPVIISDASSLPEVAGEAGLCVPPQDVGRWTEALRQARDDDAWRSAARQRGLLEAARYTWHNTALQTVESYRKALGKG
jgi:glycosyltransferase involved in cell wall biosynthesis